jgi:hypothetical protein
MLQLDEKLANSQLGLSYMVKLFDTFRIAEALTFTEFPERL